MSDPLAIRPVSAGSLMERLSRRNNHPTLPSELNLPQDDHALSAPVSPNNEDSPSLSRNENFITSAPTSPRSERTPLLRNGRNSIPRLRFYRSTVTKSDPGDQAKSLFSRAPKIPTSVTRAASTLFRRREGTYDDNVSKRALMTNSTGVRVWYGNYTTIDWIHDVIKDSVRVRRLRAIKGWRGWLYNAWDRSQAWLLLFLIGIVLAVFAGGIDITQEWLSDLKEGYCKDRWTSNHAFCCWNVAPGNSCERWQEWGPLLDGMWKGEPDSWHSFDASGWIMYGLIGGFYVLIAAWLVQLSRTYIYPKGGTAEGAPTPPKVATFASGGGIPEIKTILSGFVIRGFLGFRTLVVKIIGLTLATSSGLNCGKEGPLVHIACCIGNIACRLFYKYNKNDGKRREILSASAAAGVAVAFAAPIGGVLFSLECVSYYFPAKTMIRSYFCAMVAAITLKLINPFGTGKIVMFQVTYDKEWHWFEFPAFLLLGLFGGLFGAAFSYLNIHWQRFRKNSWLGRHPIIDALSVLALTVLISYSNFFSKMGLTEFVANLFAECSNSDRNEGLCVLSPKEILPLQYLLSTSLVTKCFLTVITFGLKVPAGIFLPALAVGAIFGRILGLQMQLLTWLYPTSSLFASCGTTAAMGECVIPGVYAMVGAAATLTGVTKMTVSLVVIMFELTGTLVYMLPIMAAVLVSKWVSDATGVRCIYDLINELNGHPYLDSHREYIHEYLAIDITEPMEPIDANEQNDAKFLTAKLRRLEDSGYKDAGFSIIQSGVLQGYIAANELEHALECVRAAGNEDIECTFLRERGVWDEETEEECLGEVQMGDFSQYVDRAPLTINQNASMELAMELFIKLGVRYLCVTNFAGRYLGVIHKKRLLAYLREFDE